MLTTGETEIPDRRTRMLANSLVHHYHSSRRQLVFILPIPERLREPDALAIVIGY